MLMGPHYNICFGSLQWFPEPGSGPLDPDVLSCTVQGTFPTPGYPFVPKQILLRLGKENTKSEKVPFS
jgi:hypothetical protein